MWVWEHALFNYNPKRPDSTKKDKTVEVITKADHDAALRCAKAEGLREGARLARWHAVCAFEAHPAAALERAATDIESVAKQLLDARAAQIEEGDK